MHFICIIFIHSKPFAVPIYLNYIKRNYDDHPLNRYDPDKGETNTLKTFLFRKVFGMVYGVRGVNDTARQGNGN